jgi:hypothetical protein
MVVGSDFVEKFLKTAAGLSGGTVYNTLSFTCGAETQTNPDSDLGFVSSSGTTTVTIRHPATSSIDYFDVSVPLYDDCTVELVGDDASVGADHESHFAGGVFQQSIIVRIELRT